MQDPTRSTQGRPHEDRGHAQVQAPVPGEEPACLRGGSQTAGRRHRLVRRGRPRCVDRKAVPPPPAYPPESEELPWMSPSRDAPCRSSMPLFRSVRPVGHATASPPRRKRREGRGGKGEAGRERREGRGRKGEAGGERQEGRGWLGNRAGVCIACLRESSRKPRGACSAPSTGRRWRRSRTALRPPRWPLRARRPAPRGGRASRRHRPPHGAGAAPW